MKVDQNVDPSRCAFYKIFGNFGKNRKINYFLKISMDSPATVAIDGEPAKVSNFSLTDLPKHIRSLF